MGRRRIFTYPQMPNYVFVETAAAGGVANGQQIQIEFTSNQFVNIAFPVSSRGEIWTSIYRGQQLDDLIDALTFYREEGYRDAE